MLQDYELKKLEERFEGNSKGLRNKLKELERKKFRELRKQGNNRKRMAW